MVRSIDNTAHTINITISGADEPALPLSVVDTTNDTGRWTMSGQSLDFNVASLFAGGTGLTTLARPYLVLHEYGPERAGQANGMIARGQQIARAFGPVAAAAAGSTVGYAAVFAALAVLLAAAIWLTRPPHGRH